jgi:hypothetical protein
MESQPVEITQLFFSQALRKDCSTLTNVPADLHRIFALVLLAIRAMAEHYSVGRD